MESCGIDKKLFLGKEGQKQDSGVNIFLRNLYQVMAVMVPNNGLRDISFDHWPEGDVEKI